MSDEAKIKKEIVTVEKALGEAHVEYVTAQAAMRSCQAELAAAENARYELDNSLGRLRMSTLVPGRERQAQEREGEDRAALMAADRTCEDLAFACSRAKVRTSRAFFVERWLRQQLQYLKHTALSDARKAERQPRPQAQEEHRLRAF